MRCDREGLKVVAARRARRGETERSERLSGEFGEALERGPLALWRDADDEKRRPRRVGEPKEGKNCNPVSVVPREIDPRSRGQADQIMRLSASHASLPNMLTSSGALRTNEPFRTGCAVE